jgi:FkbM family methyltransferase
MGSPIAQAIRDFIKIDVEGAELNVLHGSEKLIECSHPALFFECDED